MTTPQTQKKNKHFYLGTEIKIATFYKFVALPDRFDLKPAIEAICRTHDVKGTLLLAQEGLNATLAGPAEGLDAVLLSLRQDERFADLTCNLELLLP